MASARELRYHARQQRQLSSLYPHPNNKTLVQSSYFTTNNLSSASPPPPSSSTRSKRRKNSQSTEASANTSKHIGDLALPRKFNAPRTKSGKVAACAANVGVQKGQCSCILPDGAAAPVVLRYECNVPSLVCNEDVVTAMEMLQSGTFDEQHVCGFLKHDNVNSLYALIQVYLLDKCKLAPEKIPAQFVGKRESKGDAEYGISKAAKQRLELGVDDPLPVDFVVESCGLWENDEPIVPIELQGRYWQDVKEEASEEIIALIQPTFRTPIEALAMRWMRTAAEVANYLTARDMRPFAYCSVVIDEKANTLHVELSSFTSVDDLAKKFAEKEVCFKVLGGHETENEDSDYSIVLAVPQCMLNRRRESNQRKQRDERHWSESELVRKPTVVEQMIKLPLSLVQKCIRRGHSLSSPSLLVEALNTLTNKAASLRLDGKSAEELLVWRVLQSTFSDVSPYLPEEADDDANTDYLSIPQLLGLGLVFQADTDKVFQLPQFLKKQLHEVAIRLQAKESSEDLWPWKGWAIKYRKKGDKALFLEEATGSTSTLRNALRCLVAVDLPISEQERDMYKRYLLVGLAKGAAYETALQPLAATNPAERKASVMVEEETRLAALDHSVYPAMLAHYQAALPFPPRSMRQHGVKALEQLVYRLSSGINVRIVKAEMEGSEVHNLFRMQQYLAKESKEDSSPPARRKAKVKSKPKVVLSSAVQSLNLTPHGKSSPAPPCILRSL